MTEAPPPDLAAVLDRLAVLERKLDRANRQLEWIRELVGPFAATFPDGSMLCQSLYGNKYFIDPEDRIMAPQMVVYRQWERPLSQWVTQTVTPDTVFVDVGANFGYFTVLAASRIGQSGRGRVIAFEPNPRLADLLRRNLQINWSMAPVDFHAEAVTAQAGTVQLHVPAGASANASLTRIPGEGEAVAVDAVRLDDVVAADIAVDVLKIDVEGHEAGVLAGAQGVIARSPAIRIVMEWSPKQMRQARVDPQTIADLLPGFVVREFGAQGLTEARDFAWLMAQPYCNVLLTRD